MLFSINELTTFTAKAEDFNAPVIDVFLERDTMRISHMAVDIGGWFANHTVVIPADRISDIDPANRSVALKITKAQAKGASVLDTTGLDDTVDMGDIPQLILGPSHDAVSAAFLAKTAPDQQYLSAVSVAGSVTHHAGEDLGQVIGLIAHSDDLVASHMAVDTGLNLPDTQRVIPMSLVDTVGDKTTKTVLTVGAPTLKDSPQLENLTAIDRHWLTKVATYYGLA